MMVALSAAEARELPTNLRVGCEVCWEYAYDADDNAPYGLAHEHHAALVLVKIDETPTKIVGTLIAGRE